MKKIKNFASNPLFWIVVIYSGISIGTFLIGYLKGKEEVNKERFIQGFTYGFEWTTDTLLAIIERKHLSDTTVAEVKFIKGEGIHKSDTITYYLSRKNLYKELE